MSETTHDLAQRAEDLEHDLRLLKNELQADIVRDLRSALVQAEQARDKFKELLDISISNKAHIYAVKEAAEACVRELSDRLAAAESTVQALQREIEGLKSGDQT